MNVALAIGSVSSVFSNILKRTSRSSSSLLLSFESFDVSLSFAALLPLLRKLKPEEEEEVEGTSLFVVVEEVFPLTLVHTVSLLVAEVLLEDVVSLAVEADCLSCFANLLVR